VVVPRFADFRPGALSPGPDSKFSWLIVCRYGFTAILGEVRAGELLAELATKGMCTVLFAEVCTTVDRFTQYSPTDRTVVQD
jgi:hypothetical protein